MSRISRWTFVRIIQTLVTVGSVAAAIVLLLTGRFPFAAVAALLLAVLLNVLEGQRYLASTRSRDREELGRLTEALDAAESRLDTLRGLTDLLVRPLDPEGIVEAAAADIGTLVHAGGTAVFLQDQEAGALELARTWRFRIPPKGLSIPLGEPSPLADAFKSETATLLDRRHPDIEPILRMLGERRSGDPLAVPLTAGGETFGLVLAGGTRRPFTLEELEIARTVAAEAAVALSNARLLANERRARRHADGLRRIAQILSSADDLADRLERAGEAVSALLQTGRVHIVFGQRRTFGMPPSPDPALEERLLSMWVAEAGDGDEWVLATPGDDESGEDLTYLFPVRREGQVVAAVAVLVPSMLDDEQCEFAAAAAKQVALALDNAYLLGAARARAADLETVFLISEAVSSSLEPNVVLARVLDVVLKLLAADAAMLMTWDSPKRLLRGAMSRGVRSRGIVLSELEPGEDLPGRVFEQGRPERLGSLSAESTPLTEAAAAEGFMSWMAVPLLARGRSVGVLSLLSRYEDGFSQSDEDLVSTFASQAALAIDNATLYGREHHVASVMQSGAQPARIPELPGLEVATLYRPAGLDSEIGGDFYDVFHAPDGRVVLVIADICGKGVQAATKTTRVKYLLRGLVAAGMGPTAGVAELNRALCEEGSPWDIVTAWIGFMEVRTGVLEHVGAGHPPALLSTPESRVILRLGATGPLLGAAADAVYESERTRLQPGTTLLLYTDGVTEARRGKEFFGEQRIREVLLQERSAAQVRERLDAALRDFTGDSLRDDVAALAVTLTGEVFLGDVARAV